MGTHRERRQRRLPLHHRFLTGSYPRDRVRDEGDDLVPFNLAVRFLLELVGVASLAYWGSRLPSTTPVRVGLAIAAPAALIVVWALVVAPGADNPLSQTTRMLIGSVLLLLASYALAVAGQTRLAVAFAAVVVLNTALMLLFPDEVAS